MWIWSHQSLDPWIFCQDLLPALRVGLLGIDPLEVPAGDTIPPKNSLLGYRNLTAASRSPFWLTPALGGMWGKPFSAGVALAA